MMLKPESFASLPEITADGDLPAEANLPAEG
jgi:hypothetical protein